MHDTTSQILIGMGCHPTAVHGKGEEMHHPWTRARKANPGKIFEECFIPTLPPVVFEIPTPR